MITSGWLETIERKPGSNPDAPPAAAIAVQSAAGLVLNGFSQQIIRLVTKAIESIFQDRIKRKQSHRNAKNRTTLLTINLMAEQNLQQVQESGLYRESQP